MSGVLNLLLAGAASAIKDAYFNLTTLLLNTSSTNGAQNNTFLDSSTNNFTITRNGNTTQGTFTPFSQTGWGNYFDGSSYLSIANNANLNLNSSNFTIEFWIYAPSSTGPNGIISKGNTSSLGSDAWSIEWTNTTGTLGFGSGAFNGWAAPIVTGTVTLNAWNHVAVVRNGTSHALYINGTSASTATASYTVTSAGSLYIGTGWYAPSSRYMTGYVSNARIVIGTAVYTSNFTPSTTPLTAITNTQLLTCQSNRFLDNSANAFTITTSGTPSVQAFSPFLPTAAYDTAVVGGSGYFDGSGDNISVPSATALQLNTSVNWTIEAWVYPTTLSGDNGIIAKRGASVEYQFSHNSGIGLNIYTGPTTYGSGKLLTVNQWQHCAATWDGTTLRFFVNGVQTPTTHTGISLPASSTNNFTVGANGTTEYFTGYICGARLVKGTAVYTASFTPPTAPPTAITNTSFLCNYTNAGIYDSAAKNVLETVGNAQVSTTQAKWGTTSMAFDGTGDTLNSPPNQVLSLGSGNWTIECWVRLNATGTETTIGQSKNYYTAGFNGNFIFRVGTTNLWRSFDGQSNQATIDGSFSWSTGVWYHVAWVRNSGTVTVYRDGTSLGSVADSKTLSDSANGIIIGSSLNAYIDDLRITVGLARYTTTFTPPTAAFPLQ